MLSIIIWHFLFITLSVASALASTSRNWPRPHLSLDLKALASVLASAWVSTFWPRLTSLVLDYSICACQYIQSSCFTHSHYKAITILLLTFFTLHQYLQRILCLSKKSTVTLSTAQNRKVSPMNDMEGFLGWTVTQ